MLLNFSQRCVRSAPTRCLVSSIDKRSFRSLQVGNVQHQVKCKEFEFTSNRSLSFGFGFGFSNVFMNSQTVTPVRFYSSKKEYPPHIVLEMPALSPTMKSGTLVKWHKSVGDEVQSGSVLADIETDKATMKWDSADEGFIAKIFIEDGTPVAVNTPVAILAEEKDDVSAFEDYQLDEQPSTGDEEAKPEKPKEKEKPKAKEAPKKEAPSEPKQKSEERPKPSPSASTRDKDRVFASPAARALAKEKGFDISQISGTGPDGRIILADVKQFSPKPTAAVSVQTIEEAEYTDIPNSNIRKVIASRLTESKQTIPHYYLTIDFCVDELLKVRNVLNSRGEGKYKISVNDFVIKASAMALRKVPEVNAAWMDTAIRRYHNVHINVAVNTDAGLYTPLIPNADNKGLTDISEQVKALASKAHKSQLSMDDLASGTFTISNLGMFGISHFAAVINPPQACILAVGGIEKRVVPVENPAPGAQPYQVSNFMSCTLSCDHRVVDGALGAIWLREFKARMEQPLTLLL